MLSFGGIACSAVVGGNVGSVTEYVEFGKFFSDVVPLTVELETEMKTNLNITNNTRNSVILRLLRVQLDLAKHSNTYRFPFFINEINIVF